jgi:hypothetical protein
VYCVRRARVDGNAVILSVRGACTQVKQARAEIQKIFEKVQSSQVTLASYVASLRGRIHRRTPLTARSLPQPVES